LRVDRRTLVALRQFHHADLDSLNETTMPTITTTAAQGSAQGWRGGWWRPAA
jgi:hypothetical protein